MILHSLSYKTRHQTHQRVITGLQERLGESSSETTKPHFTDEETESLSVLRVTGWLSNERKVMKRVGGRAGIPEQSIEHLYSRPATK